MDIGRIFSRVGAPREFFQNFSRGGEMVKFVFYHSKLRKQPFFATIFIFQGGQAPLPTPMQTNEGCDLSRSTLFQCGGVRGWWCCNGRWCCSERWCCSKWWWCWKGTSGRVCKALRNIKNIPVQNFYFIHLQKVNKTNVGCDLSRNTLFQCGVSCFMGWWCCSKRWCCSERWCCSSWCWIGISDWVCKALHKITNIPIGKVWF